MNVRPFSRRCFMCLKLIYFDIEQWLENTECSTCYSKAELLRKIIVIRKYEGFRSKHTDKMLIKRLCPCCHSDLDLLTFKKDNGCGRTRESAFTHKV